MSKSTKRRPLDSQRLREILDYNPQTGLFSWRGNIRHSRMRLGDPAGTTNRLGYVSVFIDGGHYLAHRLAWLYTTGEWPSLFIDHIDGNPSNNALNNLREATQAQNCQNARGKNARAGVKGAYRKRNKWTSTIRVAGVNIHLGCFDTAEDASSAYAAAAKKYFGEFARAA